MKYTKRFYGNLLESHKLKKHYVKNAIFSFLFGGGICLLGEFILWVFKMNQIAKEQATTYMLILMISIAILLSGFGIYDKMGQVAKAGSVIPITGFANSMSSSAMEYRPEGFILGVGANTFKLAGTVIVFGVFSAFIVATIKYLWWLF